MKLVASNSMDPVTLGVECSFSDGRDSMPIKTTPFPPEKGDFWLVQKPDGDEWLEWPLRILSSRAADIPESIPFGEDVISNVNPKQGSDYKTLWQAEGGGSTTLVGAPTRFIAQTPRDGKPFCSMALTTTGYGRGLVRGIYYYTSPIYGCSEILKDAKLYSGWRSSGWQIMVLPLAFLGTHVVQKAKEISQLNHQLSDIENLVTKPRRPDGEDDLDSGVLTRKLHECHAEVFRLERRAHFENGLMKNIETLMAAAKKDQANIVIAQSSLDLVKTMMDAQSYDLIALPKRIESQRAMIFNLIVQRDARLNIQIGKTNMEIADTSRRIAEASMRDAAAMKTISVMTMIFLPGTAVASIFSMTVFRWDAAPGESLVSAYIWIYFAVSVPLTLVVMAIWYFLYYVRGRSVRRFSTSPVPLVNFRFSNSGAHEEDAIGSTDSKNVTYTA